jgi:hypothetical protein
VAASRAGDSLVPAAAPAVGIISTPSDSLVSQGP